MKRILAAAVTLSLLATAGPALAAPQPRFGACMAPDGATVIKAGSKPVEQRVPTPIVPLLLLSTPVGTFYLDMQGKPTTAKGKLTFTLSWPDDLSDYDLILNGRNVSGSFNPEIVDVKVPHCRPVQIDVKVFLGVPTDELTLSTKGA